MEGERAVAGLGAPVRIERDALGVPVVRGGSRLDVARATGFLHAQERFFQMDLLRRSAAGELAALFGRPGARDGPRGARPPAPPRRPAGREGAARGRAGPARRLRGGGERGPRRARGPALRVPGPARRSPRSGGTRTRSCAPSPCTATSRAGSRGRSRMLGLMRETLPPALADFLAPVGTEWDAPIEGDADPDARRAGAGGGRPAAGAAGGGRGRGLLAVRARRSRLPRPADRPRRRRATTTSSAAATTGRWRGRTPRTAAPFSPTTCTSASPSPTPGTALSLVFPGVDGERRVTGVTLPGAPFVVAGSNGHVAWGFTNSEGDWADLVLLEPDPANPEPTSRPRARGRSSARPRRSR